jgi:nucleotide-binding universal stress UspA family protein
MPDRPIVVGVDGSPLGHAALRWAADAAAHHHRPLEIVHGYVWPDAAELIWPPGHALAEYASGAEALVAEASAEVAADFPGVAVHGTARVGDAAEILVTSARHAAMVVVGGRGRNPLTSVLLGSVSRAVSTRAACSVTVVHGPPTAPTGPVLVGADSSAGAEVALRAGFDEAQARGCGLLAVRAWTPPGPPWRSDVRPAAADVEEIEAAERHALADAVLPWRTKYPDVPVELRAVPGDAGEALVRIGRDARLTVVGTRGRRGVAGLLPGSVSQHVVHHVSGPVLIARASLDHELS